MAKKKERNHVGFEQCESEFSFMGKPKYYYTEKNTIQVSPC